MTDKFIVIARWNYQGAEWRVVRESGLGVDFEIAERIRNYQVELGGIKPANARVACLKADVAEVMDDGQA